MLIYDKNLRLKSVLGFLTGILLITALIGCSSPAKKPATPEEEPLPLKLFPDLGAHHYPISTVNPVAQRYFDQGLILAFGFNHAEAARSFQEAYRLDPACTLCYWGEALVLGPNINAPMDPSVVPKASKLVKQALAVTENATTKEKALISALAERYSESALPDRKPLDEAYAAAMRNVARSFPGDSVIAALFAESLMDLHPWNFWSKQGEARPWTAEIVATLEHAMEIDASNPLANHLYIHALEASPQAAKALPSARRLPSLVPGSGHLVHMPAHIYIRIGHYRDAILANQRAVKIDQHYLHHKHSESLYTIAYVPHNHHFLWAAAIKTGQKHLASKAAADAVAQVKQELLRTPRLSGTLQHFATLPLYTKALFGEWDAILNEPAPAADLLYPSGIWHYARGLALLRKGKPDESAQELKMLERIIQDPALAKLTVFDLNSITDILQIAAEILHGELAAQTKDFGKAIAHLQRAVKIEDGLNYTEPKDWYLPPRQVLGAVLLKAGKAKEAEQAYRQDLVYHPQNGWSLFGLTHSLQDQGKRKEAGKIKRQFEDVWADADVALTGSVF